MTAVLADLDEYTEFLRAKCDFESASGFDVHPDRISPVLLPHQKAIVQWALHGGRRAIFAAFGLGKSVIQLELMRLILEREQCRCLIVCPLGVRQEFVRDARQMLDVDVAFVRHTADVDGPGIYLTNYESIRDGRLDPSLFDAVSLDEASVLRSFGSKTYQTFLTLFDQTKYRFVATATPSPNRYKELIHYAGFLGVMDTGQALTRFFQRDSTKANHLTLYPHKETEFWLWLHSWAIFLQKPSDLGYPDDGYDLPPLDVRWHEVPVVHGDGGHDRDGQGRIFRDTTLGVSEAAREKRETLEARVSQVLAILEGYGHLGRATGLPAEVLPGEPGTTAGRAARAESPQLREEQADLCGEGSTEPTEEVRADRDRVRRAARSSGPRVPDLREDHEPAGGGPRPRDGRGPGPAVQDVQHGDRSAPRGHVGAGECDRVLDQIVIWCDLNAEQRAIEDALRRRGLTYSSIDGSLDVDEVERRLEEWRDRRTYALIGKPVMLGQGMNLQQCNKAIFVGVTHKFNQTIQATHRIYRFGQTRTAEVHFVYAESEREVVKALQIKWNQDREIRERMTDIIKEHQLDGLSVTEALARSIGVERVEASGEGWTAVNNDCVVETASMDTGSVDLIVTSIPFANHYEYTPSYNDFGHTDDNAHFWAQMDHLTPELRRVLAPGRIYCCHVKDRILFGNTTGKGYSTVSPFHAEAIAHGVKHGFDYLGMITVVTDVVRENNQSYRLGWSEQCRDGSRMGVGSPEYVLIFRSPQTDRTQGRADRPVTKSKDDYSRSRWQIDAHGFWRSNGNRQLAPEDFDGLSTAERGRLFESWTAANLYDHDLHVRIGERIDGKGQLPATFMLLAPASPHPDVWADVNRMLTLNGAQSQQGRALHVCPLQFDLVDRLIERYSNPGDLVYDPFGGLMTVPVRALRAKRRGRAVELNGDYWRDGVRYLQAAELEVGSPTLFDLIEAEAS